MSIGFPEESEQFCTLDYASFGNKHLRRSCQLIARSHDHETRSDMTASGRAPLGNYGSISCFGGFVRTDATMMRLVCETPQRGVMLPPSGSLVGRIAPD